MVDRETKEIRAFAELYDVKTVSYREFIEQYGGDRMTADMWAQHRSYYAMCFRNVEKCTSPVNIREFHVDGVWAELPDDIGRMRQRSILEF